MRRIRIGQPLGMRPIRRILTGRRSNLMSKAIRSRGLIRTGTAA
jgi:hypothetical protein